VREFTYLSDGGFSIEGDGVKYSPWGFGGGTDGSPAAMMHESKGKSATLPSKEPYKKAKAGDRLVTYGPSGGGYGDPFKRKPEAVLDNVLDGLITVERARESYGVAIVAGKVDSAATAKLRGR
jgi:N-methylhydantoinase B